MNWLIKQLLKRLSKAEKHTVLTELVKHLFNTISAEDILQEHNGEWIYRGKNLIPGEKDAMIADAQMFYKSRLWQVLQDDAKYQANRRMYLKSRTENDMIAGKMLVYNLDILNTRLKSMVKGTGIFNK
jgi:hypothetical protein